MGPCALNRHPAIDGMRAYSTRIRPQAPRVDGPVPRQASMRPSKVSARAIWRWWEWASRFGRCMLTLGAFALLLPAPRLAVARCPLPRRKLRHWFLAAAWQVYEPRVNPRELTRALAPRAAAHEDRHLNSLSLGLWICAPAGYRMVCLADVWVISPWVCRTIRTTVA
jgi:hypothetical protein